MALLKPVAPEERNLGGWDFFLLWAGAAISLGEIWAGGLLVPLGFVAGLLAILLGHVVGNTPMAMAGIMGSRHGVPAMVSTRGALGNRGSILPAVLNVIQLIGWTAVMVYVAGKAAAPLTPHVGWLDDKSWMAIIGVVTTAWALIGRRFWKWIERVAVVLLLMLSLFMTWIVVCRYGLGTLLQSHRQPGFSFMLGVDLVIAMPISWLPLVSDYSRYARGTRGCFWGTWWGYFAGGCLMYAVGLATALATKSNTPDGMVVDLMSSLGFVVPALLVVLLSTFTTAFLDIYSNAVSVPSILPRLNEKVVIAAGGALGTLLAVRFPADQYQNFLLFIGSAFCPLFGVVLADYFILRKMSYRADDLFRRGIYWFKGGVNPWAVAAWAAGFVLYQVSTRRGWPIGASLPALIGAGVLYLVLMVLFGPRPAEAEAAEESEAGSGSA
ncbi:MAG: putative hydroxymethylpyrimidine transporter CytX [Verrucomicrobiota bacterium]